MKKIISLFALIVAFILPWAPARAEEKAHDCLVVVLDGSGSMGPDHQNIDGRSKMDVAKDALKKVLSKVPSDTWVGIVVFNGRFGGSDDWIVPLGPRDPETDKKIDSVWPGGSTPLGTYIGIGATRLFQEREAQYNLGRYRLIVVTDGEADEGQEASLMKSFSTDAVERGLRLDVIGLAMDDTHALAAMADSYQPAQNAQELDRALARVVRIESSSDPGQAGGDDFAVMSALTDDVALGLIQAVTAPKGNWPSGKPPSPKEAGAEAPASPSAPESQPSGGACSVIGFGSISALALWLVLPAALRRRSSAG